MSVVIGIAAALLVVAAGLLLFRTTVGPTILDRSMALDVLMSVTVCAMALWSVQQDSSVALPAILAVAAVGFVGSIAIARYASGIDDVAAEAEQQEDEQA
ncbi:monovalent cation/H+ antiporter complex subunit F [Nocardioides campestrisoli]|uniref:monovalent cation/H+ antiporter complex subunit F n=1 Tax=Nocardioides campestrisoli TaxID=2736757 RepID=UPI0015E670F2|nr:monovalent cation/H+ antiporter complex subunit F [Nocardioides campestrisoli]